MSTFTLGPLQEKWLQELESGKHEQGNGYLCTESHGVISYCCLGVAAEFVLGLCKSITVGSPTIVAFDGRIQYLKDWERLGLRDDAGVLLERAFLKDRLFRSLTDINDAGVTFKEIAAYIRANPWNVFIKSC